MEILAKGRVISSIATSWGEMAWKIEDALDVLEYFSSQNHLVLGGDILDLNFEYTYDNWYYNGSSSKGSISVSEEYLFNFIKNNGKNYYVVFVCEK